MPNWTPLSRQSPIVSTEAVVGIQVGGKYLSLNRAAVNALGGAEYVEIVYDKNERLVGLMPSVKTPSSYPLQGQSNASGKRISGKTLVRVMNIDVSRPMRYEAKVQDGMLVIDLKSGGLGSSRSG